MVDDYEVGKLNLWASRIIDGLGEEDEEDMEGDSNQVNKTSENKCIAQLWTLYFVKQLIT